MAQHAPQVERDGDQALACDKVAIGAQFRLLVPAQGGDGGL